MDFFSIFIVGSFLVCLPSYVYLHYSEGCDLFFLELVAMIFCACVPVLNIILLLFLLNKADKIDFRVLKGKDVE